MASQHHRRCVSGHCYCSADLKDKVAIVTGSNTGIGKETANDLAQRGASVVLACRDVAKAKTAAEWIRQQKVEEVNVKVYKLDLGSMKSIREFAEQVLQDYSKIHILINNAGIMYCDESETEDGFETQMGVNHLGHFLLTFLLLDRMKESAPSRIVTVSSNAHMSAHLNVDDIFMKQSGYSGFRQYGNSKLANILFTRLLAKKLSGSGVTVVSLHPGVVKTDLARHIQDWNVFVRGVSRFFFMFCKTPLQGAQTTIHCAVCPDIEQYSGQYFSDCKPKQTSRAGNDMELAEKLWAVSESLVDITY